MSPAHGRSVRSLIRGSLAVLAVARRLDQHPRILSYLIAGHAGR
jgi:hypothetical protein